MKSTTKLTIKLFLVISLFVSVGFADDGHMGTGGFAGDTPCVATTDDGHMGTGGIVCDDSDSSADDGHMGTGGRAALSGNQKSDDSILDIVRNYLLSMFG